MTAYAINKNKVIFYTNRSTSCETRNKISLWSGASSTINNALTSSLVLASSFVNIFLCLRLDKNCLITGQVWLSSSVASRRKNINFDSKSKEKWSKNCTSLIQDWCVFPVLSSVSQSYENFYLPITVIGIHLKNFNYLKKIVNDFWYSWHQQAGYEN